jgi:ubiquinone/menaquinone biosynthesis C-methylase UbiE
MTPERPDPTPIQALATAYWNSATLLAANDLDLFGAVAEGAQTAAQIAAQLGTAPRATERLLDACVGLGLLTKETGGSEPRYANTPAANAYLVPGSSGYLGGALRWSAEQYTRWGRLAETVRTGAPAAAPALHLGDDSEQTRTFVLGMHQRAQGLAQGVLAFLDFEGVTRLLDVGGGPGTYASLLAQKYPALSVTVLDLPGIVAVAQELLAEAGMADRVATLPGDATQDDFGAEQYEGVLCSGVLHQMSATTIRKVLAKSYRALVPGGRIVISDLMLDADKTQPAFATLFSLQMLLSSAEGAVFSEVECQEWLEEVGFTDVTVRRLPPALPYSVVTGWKRTEQADSLQFPAASAR